MPRYNFRIVSSYPPRECGIGIFSQNLIDALGEFTGEVGSINVAAVDNTGEEEYHYPADLDIDQYDPDSWVRNTNQIINRAYEKTHDTIVLLQHEYGLDGEYPKGKNYVSMAEKLKSANLFTLIYLHTVLENPDEYQKNTIIALAEHSDGLIVTTESAVDLLSSEEYEIDRSKIHYIDHGIRMQDPSKYPRHEMKRRNGLENLLVVTTLGLRSTNKGVQHGILAYSRLINKLLKEREREKIIYLVVGKCHPDFMKTDEYKDYEKIMNDALDQSKLKYTTIKKFEEFSETDFRENDLVFLDTFLSNKDLKNFYATSDLILLPYLNRQQISSGILADALGFGRAVIATKFAYAKELLDPERKSDEKGIFGINKHTTARGILVDIDPVSIPQISEALAYLVSHRKEREKIEQRSYERGHRMQWKDSAWALLRRIAAIKDQREVEEMENIELELKEDSFNT